MICKESAAGWHRVRCRTGRSSGGFTTLELVVTVAVGLIMAAVAIPGVLNAVRYFQFRSAVASVTGAIQAARYQAIFKGCPYQLAFNEDAYSYQVSGQASTPAGCNGVFAPVGGVVPLSGSGVKLGVNTTLQFRPGGSVQAIVGAQTLTLTSHGNVETITVSNYGNVTVYP